MTTLSHPMYAACEHDAPRNAISPREASGWEEADTVDVSLYAAGSYAAEAGTASSEEIGWQHEESYGEEGEEEWWEEEEEAGEEEDYEGGGGYEESESSGSSSSGEEEPPCSKRARAEPGLSSAAAPLTDSEPLVQYEIERMNNIRRNNEKLESLGIIEAKVAIRPAETADQSNPTHRTSLRTLYNTLLPLTHLSAHVVAERQRKIRRQLLIGKRAKAQADDRESNKRLVEMIVPGPPRGGTDVAIPDNKADDSGLLELLPPKRARPCVGGLVTSSSAETGSSEADASLSKTSTAGEAGTGGHLPPSSTDPGTAVGEHLPSFAAAASFMGARHGMVYRLGSMGLGYYRDAPPAPMLEDSIARPSAANTMDMMELLGDIVVHRWVDNEVHRAPTDPYPKPVLRLVLCCTTGRFACTTSWFAEGARPAQFMCWHTRIRTVTPWQRAAFAATGRRTMRTRTTSANGSQSAPVSERWTYRMCW